MGAELSAAPADERVRGLSPRSEEVEFKLRKKGSQTGDECVKGITGRGGESAKALGWGLLGGVQGGECGDRWEGQEGFGTVH